MRKRARNHELLVDCREIQQTLKRILPSDAINNDFRYKMEYQDYEPQGKQEAGRLNYYTNGRGLFK